MTVEQLITELHKEDPDSLAVISTNYGHETVKKLLPGYWKGVDNDRDFRKRKVLVLSPAISHCKEYLNNLTEGK